MVRDPSRKGFGRLAEQSGSGAAEHQEARLVVGPVHEHPQESKDPRAPLNLVDDDQSPEGFEREPGVGEPCFVGRILQIEQGDGPFVAAGQTAGECRLADLPRADEADDRKLVEERADGRFVARAWNHVREYTGISKATLSIFPLHGRPEGGSREGGALHRAERALPSGRLVAGGGPAVRAGSARVSGDVRIAPGPRGRRPPSRWAAARRPLRAPRIA